MRISSSILALSKRHFYIPLIIFYNTKQFTLLYPYFSSDLLVFLIFVFLKNMQNRGTGWTKCLHFFKKTFTHTHKIELNSIHMQVNKLNMVEFNRCLKKTFSHMKNFSYYFTQNEWNNSTSFLLLSSHNNAIISQTHGMKKRHLWKPVCFSFKTAPFFKRYKYHDLRNVQPSFPCFTIYWLHRHLSNLLFDMKIKMQKKNNNFPSHQEIQRSKKSLWHMLSLLISPRFHNSFFFGLVLWCPMLLKNGSMFILRSCPFRRHTFITNPSSFRNRKIVAYFL